MSCFEGQTFYDFSGISVLLRVEIVAACQYELREGRDWCSQCHKFSAENVHVLVKPLHRKNACEKHWYLINVSACISFTFTLSFQINGCYKVSY